MPKAILDRKKCSNCKILLSLDCFCKDKSSLDGLCYQCRNCRNSVKRDGYKNGRVKKYESAYSEKDAQRARKLYVKNKVKRLEYQKEWKEKNKDKVRRYTHAYRARKFKAEGSYELSDIKLILRIQENKCYYCGIELKDYHIDHKQPLSKGGSNWPNNLCIACPTCNVRKKDKSEQDFINLINNEGCVQTLFCQEVRQLRQKPKKGNRRK